MAFLFSVQLHVNTHINTQHGFAGLCLSPRTHAKSKSLLDFVHFTCLNIYYTVHQDYFQRNCHTLH